ncbi:hypothetical protein [Aureivirga sp. CE67]|uniref:hypothetical protein n=1 Tax=Aureivirga sp. CE67 TaxID=1788983 RepID=UPI0018CBCE39|nr:hypothetical protein [Aureivirga sp. CE67]
MLKKLFFLFIISLISCSKSKTENKIQLETKPLQETIDNQKQKGETKALEDIKKGGYELFIPRDVSNDMDFLNFYEKYLKDVYNVNSVFDYCEPTPFLDAYYKTMEKEFYKNHDENIFYKIIPNVEKAYKIDIQNKIENNYFFSKVDKKPSFIGGNEKLKKYLKNNFSEINLKNKRIIVFLDFNKDGKIVKVRIRNDIDKRNKKIIESTFLNSPNWNPAIKNGKAVICRVAIPLRF